MEPLTKSYTSSYDSQHPLREDLTLYKVFEEAKGKGLVGEILNLETNTRISTEEVFAKADQYAKGLLACGCVPGKDALCSMGVSSLEPISLFVAAASIGVGFGKPYIYTPREQCIINVVSALEPKVIVVGEADYGDTFSALVPLFDDCETPTSSKLPTVKHVFYDHTHKDRSPSHKFLNNLDKLIEMGKVITDDELAAAKRSVQPGHDLFYTFSSGSTGKPKCIVHTNVGLANDLLLLPDSSGPVLTMNPSMDETSSFAFVVGILAGKTVRLILSMQITPENAVEKTGMLPDVILNEKIETLGMGGQLVQLIAHHMKRKGNVEVPHLKYILYGGQVVTRQFKENIKAVFGEKHIAVYGMSEVAIVSLAPTEDGPEYEEARLDGKLYIKPNLEIRLVDQHSEIVDIGEEGELEVKTYSSFKEYKGMEEKTRATFTKDGFVKTGDVAVMFADGSHHIRGRATDAFRFKIMAKAFYPGPIEDILVQFPGVTNAVVSVALTNDAYGDEVTYCISMSESVPIPSEQDLLDFMKKKGIDKHQMPARILYFDSFPSTPNSRKISKPGVKEEIMKRVETDPNAGITQWYKKLCDTVTNGFE